jgi:cytochrome c oxidase assembly factor CtaG
VDPNVSIILLSWAWRPHIILTIVLAATLHLVGRNRLKRRGGGRVIAPWRSVAYLGGLVVLWIALMSPIDVLSGQLFSMHMIQHLLLVMVVPPLLWIGNPMPIAMWGLPATLRREVGRWLRPSSGVRNTIRALTTPGLVWLYFVAALVGWHDPRAYNLSLVSELAHDLEHLMFFVSAMLLWWHVIGSAPLIHKRLSRGVRAAYIVSVVPANALTGIAISFASEPLYPYYTTVPRVGQMTVLQDQMLGGVLMWIPGSMMYLLAALILISQIIRAEEDTEPAPGKGSPAPRGADNEVARPRGLEKQNGPPAQLEETM